MSELLPTIQSLIDSDLKFLVDSRLEEFSHSGSQNIQKIFVELCFCIMTANCAAEKCIEIHETIGDEFLHLSEANLVAKFKELGYRFPNVRAKYITEAKHKIRGLERVLNSDMTQIEIREWMVKNIKGIGFKEGSHFLRNIGFNNVGIIDFHIVDLLEKNGLIERPKTLCKSKYYEIEAILKDIANELNLSLGELDLYMWYLETQKVLK